MLNNVLIFFFKDNVIIITSICYCNTCTVYVEDCEHLQKKFMQITNYFQIKKCV